MAQKICELCHEDCARNGQPYAYKLTRGPGFLQFSLQAIAPPESIDGEAICRSCYNRELCGV